MEETFALLKSAATMFAVCHQQLNLCMKFISKWERQVTAGELGIILSICLLIQE